MALLFVAAEAAELKPFANRLTGLRKLNWPLDYAYEGICDGRRILLAANGAGQSWRLARWKWPFERLQPPTFPHHGLKR